MNVCPDHREPDATCEECSAAAAVDPWMKRFANLSVREHILPHPSIVWLKSQVMQTSSEAARASRPMTVVQIICYLIVASGWAAVLTWKSDAIARLLHPFQSPTATLATFAAVTVLATITVTLALHTILAEE